MSSLQRIMSYDGGWWTVMGEHQGCEAVTVVIPTYNGAAYIEETLESLRQQTTDDFEVVVDRRRFGGRHAG